MELIGLAQRSGGKSGVPEGLSEVRGKAVQGEDFSWVHRPDKSVQILVVGMIAERECRVSPVSVSAIRVKSPPGEHSLPMGTQWIGIPFEFGSRRAEDDASLSGLVAG